MGDTALVSTRFGRVDIGSGGPRIVQLNRKCRTTVPFVASGPNAAQAYGFGVELSTFAS